MPWSSFKFRDYTLLWTSGISMMIVMQVREFASAQWLWEETQSEFTLGLLFALRFIQMPVALYGGLLADVMNRKKLMALTQFASFISLLVLTLLAAFDSLQPWHIFAVTAIVTPFNMLGNSARPAMLPRVLPRSHLTNGVTLQTAAMQVAQIGAPLLFGVLFAGYTILGWELGGFGATSTFLVATVIAGISFLTPLLISASGEPDGGSRKVTLESLKEGFTFVKSHKILPGLYLLDIGVTIVSFYRMLFPIFSEQLYGMGADGTGLLGAANALGGIAGSFLVFFTARILYKGRIVLVATLAYAFLLIAFGLVETFWIGLIIVGALGGTDSVGMTMRQAVVQLTTPDRMLGRASSAHSFAAMGANNIGGMEVSFVAGIIGASGTMVFGGVFSIAVVILIWWFVPGIRRYRYSESELPDGEPPPK